MTWRAEVVATSSVPASKPDVWARVISVEGINHELGPWLKMTVPRNLRGASVDTVERGMTLGRSWILLFRVLPVDYDDLCLAEVDDGTRFLERSQLASMRVWEHERTLEGSGDETLVTDRLTFEPRLLLRLLPGSKRLASAVVRRIFRHRHRRLRQYFETH